MIPVGPMVVGHHKGEVLGACTDCRRLWGKFRAGEIDEAEIEAVNGRLAPSVGTCMVMGTASTMACITEALGMSLPMSATIPAPHADRFRSPRPAASVAAQMAVAKGPKPSEILTAGLVQNALIVLQAIGGSTNGLDPSDRDRRPHRHRHRPRGVRHASGREVPVLVDLKPSGAALHGALPPCRRRAEADARAAASCSISTRRTVTGHDARATIDARGPRRCRGRTSIRTLDESDQAGRRRWRCCAAISRRAARSSSSRRRRPKLLQHTGRAVVFESRRGHDARASTIPTLDVNADDVLVLRNAGPKGAPGMPEAGYLPIPMKLARAGVKDMVRISDARMSGTAFGTIVLHVTPESAVGGPLALVRNGDRIRLSVIEARDQPARPRRANSRRVRPTIPWFDADRGAWIPEVVFPDSDASGQGSRLRFPAERNSARKEQGERKIEAVREPGDYGLFRAAIRLMRRTAWIGRNTDASTRHTRQNLLQAQSRRCLYFAHVVGGQDPVQGHARNPEFARGVAEAPAIAQQRKFDGLPFAPLRAPARATPARTSTYSPSSRSCALIWRPSDITIARRTRLISSRTLPGQP